MFLELEYNISEFLYKPGAIVKETLHAKTKMEVKRSMARQKEHKIWNPAMECMSRDELTHMQSERLIRTVRHTYDNVPVYRERMKAAGLEPGDIHSVEDLKKLPFTTKDDLRDNYPFGLLAVPQSDIVRVQGSSGTTGKPIIAGYTAEDVEIWTEMMARTMTAAGADRNWTVQVAYGYGLFTGGLGAHQGGTRIGCTVVPLSSGNTARQIMLMKDLGVNMLCCTPSYALHIAETIHEMGMDMSEFQMKAGCFGAEPWTEAMRQRIEELLDIDALDIYGLTEIAGPGVSYECLAKQGMHICEDHVIPEIIDPETGDPLPLGEVGELVFTTITKRGMPMIRYRTHDICRLNATPCECGRTHVRMERVTGRTDDMIIIRGVNVFPSQIEGILVNMDGVAPHYMLVVDRVKSTDTLEVQVERAEDNHGDLNALAKRISARIKSVVGITPVVTLVEPKAIPRSEGKAKRVIDKRKM